MEPNPRKRSRSPYHDSAEKRHRSRSPHKQQEEQGKVKLPYKQPPLTRHDLAQYRGLLERYLAVQKGIDGLGELEEREVKGRWKSFIRKWNEGVLARGWYDPSLIHELAERDGEGGGRVERQVESTRVTKGGEMGDNGVDSEDDYGPAPLRRYAEGERRRHGPAVPSLDDLQMRREYEKEGCSQRRKERWEDRKVERKMAKDRAEELNPRAEAGSKERMLEKKREKAESNRSFKESREGGGVEDVPDNDLMGGEEGGVEGYKKQLKEQQRAKNEREIRREEVLRARAAEREERMEKFRAKERDTMSMLKEIARQRFGGGGD